jgi:hypothetical protein
MSTTNDGLGVRLQLSNTWLLICYTVTRVVSATASAAAARRRRRMQDSLSIPQMPGAVHAVVDEQEPPTS